MGIVTKITTNNLGEVTEAIVRKGKTGELTRRHITGLIPLMNHPELEEDSSNRASDQTNSITHDCTGNDRPQRTAAIRSRALTKNMLDI